MVATWPCAALHTHISRGSVPHHRGVWCRSAVLSEVRAGKRAQAANIEPEEQQVPRLKVRPLWHQPAVSDSAPASAAQPTQAHILQRQPPGLQEQDEPPETDHTGDVLTSRAARLPPQQRRSWHTNRQQGPGPGQASGETQATLPSGFSAAQPHESGHKVTRVRIGHDSQEADISEALLQLPPGAPIGPVFGAMRLTGKQIMRVLAPLSDAGAYDLALRTFEWLDAQEQPATRDCYVYTRLMSMFARERGTCGRALEIFDRMKAVGIEPDLRAYNTAINAAGKGLEWERVERLSAELKAAGLRPDVWTYSLLISACQACGNQWQRALQLFADMEDAGVQPNVITYTTLMSVCQRAGQWQRAMQIFQKMEMAGVEADVVACNAAMTACAKGGNWEKAWAVFSGMRRMGVRPNTVSYNALISVCERCGEADRALEVFRIMDREASNSSAAIRPSAVTYNTLISACAKAGKYDEAVELCQKMRDRGLQPDVFTMCGLINACEKVGLGEEALTTFHAFCEDGVAPNTIAYNSVINALGTSQHLDDALRLFAQMHGAEGVEPDVITYASLISACAKCGSCTTALELYEEMQAAQIPPNSYIFNALISACEAGNQWEKAVEIFKAMEAYDEAEMGTLAMRARRVLYAFPSLVAVMPQVLTAARLAVESGRAARRWISR